MARLKSQINPPESPLSEGPPSEGSLSQGPLSQGPLSQDPRRRERAPGRRSTAHTGTSSSAQLSLLAPPCTVARPAEFHPLVEAWFNDTLGDPTECQREAWDAIRSGQHTLIAAPTGSGKTLAAFLCAIDDVLREGLLCGCLADELRVLYVSPLKALSNDIDKNLAQPLQGIRERLRENGYADISIRSAVRTGDTPPSERERIRRQPPHILVTTPESLYLMLTAEGGRKVLRTVRTVIIDEIHALIGNKRGSHLALSMARLGHLCDTEPLRIGLSATQRPIQRVAAYLVPDGNPAGCRIVDKGHSRQLDLALELVDAPLQAIMSNEVWQSVYDRLADLIRAHQSTIVFVNTRRLAERAARFLAERLGEDAVTAHHGSLAREHRLKAESNLKGGKLRAIVATASLELGIDIGDVDLVCQLGSPHSIAQCLQRVGRAGHALGKVPKGRLFPLSRDGLVQCVALLDAIRRGELESLTEPRQPLDVLAQQLTAEVSTERVGCDALYERFKTAAHYRDLDREQFDRVVAMLSEGFSTRRGRRAAFIHLDAVNQHIGARRGARLTAITNGGAIPDQFDFDVVLEPANLPIGTLNEDFAFESLPGDIFQLGNTSYRVLRVERGVVRVEDAHGAPPSIPFWFGEAPGRSDALSNAVSRLRAEMQVRLEQGADSARQWLCETLGLPASAADQLVDYLSGALAALGVLPTQTHVVFERFFDDVGDMHFVIHSPYGSRLNRAWGLALRKRFCRKFNFELQAAALDDALVLSLGSTHSFVAEDVARYLRADTVRDVLIQALLDAPMFETRWRWVANIALAVRRNRNGKRVPPQFQRSDAEDLIALIFPDQLACLENIAGPREIPDHPLVNQAIHDCLTEVMDIDGLEDLLRRLEAGQVTVTARDLTEPSQLAQEITSAKAYAFLDDAPAEERRTLAVNARRHVSAPQAAETARIDPRAIDAVVAELRPTVRDADELHDALVTHGTLCADAVDSLDPQSRLLAELYAAGRATRLSVDAGRHLIVAAERLAELNAVHPDSTLTPVISPAGAAGCEWTREAALREIVRSMMDHSGPRSAEDLAATLSVNVSSVETALIELESEGYAMRVPRLEAGNRLSGGESNRLPPGSEDSARGLWCQRNVLARIHRRTLRRLRADIEPVSTLVYQQFLFAWHGVDAKPQGGDTALKRALSMLQGCAASLSAWHDQLLPLRVRDYRSEDLNRLCLGGEYRWQRAFANKMKTGRAPIKSTPIVLLERSSGGLTDGYPVTDFSGADVPSIDGTATISKDARCISDVLQRVGAAYYDEIVAASGLPQSRAWSAIAELVSAGLLVSDGITGLDALMTSVKRRPSAVKQMAAAGRFTMSRSLASFANGGDESARRDQYVSLCADILLQRYGVVFRKLLERERDWLPPWRELLSVWRRREARGELRAGRIVAGVSGEQFALPDALQRLRQLRKQKPDCTVTRIGAADPLNLVGVLTQGPRVPALAQNHLVYLDGECVGVQYGERLAWLRALSTAETWLIRHALGRLGGEAAPDLSQTNVTHVGTDSVSSAGMLVRRQRHHSPRGGVYNTGS